MINHKKATKTTVHCHHAGILRVNNGGLYEDCVASVPLAHHGGRLNVGQIDSYPSPGCLHLVKNPNEVPALNIILACICLCIYFSTHIKVSACDIYSVIP